MLERLRKDDEGFTLIELLIVIVILGILAAIVVFAVGGITDRGNVSACKADVTSAQTAVEAYRAQNGSYPNALSDLVPTFMRSTHAAGQNGYTITYNNSTGAVGATGLAGCPS